MSDKSEISWTDATWNPVRGCSLVSEGCRSCYAMKQAHRFSSPGQPYEGLTRLGPRGPTWTGTIRLVPEKLMEPLKWKKPRRIFVNSMSDLFHEDVPDEYIDRVFAVMALSPQHTFQVLTKRADRMLRYCTTIGNDDGEYEPDLDGEALRDAMIEGEAQRLFVELGGSTHTADYLAVHQPLPNVWLGVSVENQKCADERIPLLLETPAAVRFISAEPLLGPLDLRQLLGRLSWVIAGGESGSRARPMDPSWVLNIRDQCLNAAVPFFFKQWGGVVKSRTGRELEGRTWDQMPDEAQTD